MNYSASILLLILCFSCSKNNIHFSSPDGKNNISILTYGDSRYIANGIHSRIPDDDYIKIDISKVDGEVGDQIVGCWGKNGFEWVIMMNDVEIIENRLDKKKHLFLSNFPRDSTYNVPTLKGYKGANCFSISYSYRHIERSEGAILRE